IRQCNQALIPISIIQKNDFDAESLHELEPSFMYTQLIKEIVLEIKYNDESRQLFVNFCREYYADNNRMLDTTDQFEREYALHSPIWWYSKETFLYSIINRSLRILDVKIIMKIVFFMHDLHCQIEHLYQEWIDKPNLLTVYRGQIVTQSDFEKLKKGQGGLLSFNSFLSTSTNREVALIFADSNESDATTIGIFFEIKINSKISSTPFISLGNLSHFEEENEILFSMHSIFEIGDIYQINERLWQVELLSTTNNDKRMTELTNCIRQHTTKSEGLPWFRLAELFVQMAHHNEAEGILQQFTDFCSTYAPDSMSYAKCSHALGAAKRPQGDFSKAFSLFEQALQIYTIPDTFREKERAVAHDYSESVQLVSHTALNCKTLEGYAGIMRKYSPNRRGPIFSEVFIRLVESYDQGEGGIVGTATKKEKLMASLKNQISTMTATKVIYEDMDQCHSLPSLDDELKSLRRFIDEKKIEEIGLQNRGRLVVYCLRTLMEDRQCRRKRNYRFFYTHFMKILFETIKTDNPEVN
ncbi:unnamed protein product, partial [Adineta steineri]